MPCECTLLKSKERQKGRDISKTRSNHRPDSRPATVNLTAGRERPTRGRLNRMTSIEPILTVSSR